MSLPRITVVCVIALCTTTAIAAEITIQNDSIPAAGSGTPLVAFLANEQAAAWLTTPVSGDIVGVQILWASQIGGAPASQELAIHVYDAGTFPAPGALLASVTAPVLIDGMVNEFRFLDPPTDSTPLQVPVTSGQTFVVALEFLNQQAAGSPFVPSVEYDADGCQASKNTAFAIPVGWIDACAAGVTGDLGIRAILNPDTTLLAGDADRNGVVSAGDYGSVQINFGDSGGTWDPLLFGDADMNGVVSAGDYGSVQINFGAGGGSVEVTPEPATLSLLVIGGVVLLRRKRGYGG